MHNSVIKNTKNLVILHVFHIRKCLIFEICPQKLNKNLSNIVNIITKVPISTLFFHHLKLGIYLALKNQCLSIPGLSLSADLHVLAVMAVILGKKLAT